MFSYRHNSRDSYRDDDPNEHTVRLRALQRVGFVVEPLLGDSALCDNLHRDDAERLIEWALSHLEAEMVGSANLDSAERASQIEHKTTLVTIIVMTMNVIMGELRAAETPSEKELRLMLNDILQNCYALTGKRVNPFQVKRAVRIAQRHAEMKRDHIFAELFALIENTREIELTQPPTFDDGLSV